MNKSILELKKMNIGEIIENEELKKHTTYKVGGISNAVIYPENVTKLKELIKYIKENNIKYKIIGNGSNLLFSDKKFDGIIIKLNKLNDLQIDKNVVVVESGYQIIKLSMICASKGLSNLEFASGIPATVGGAIHSNAGAYNSEMSDVVSEVTVLDKNLNIITLKNEECNFAYRYSIFKDNNDYIILSAKIIMKESNKDEILKLIEERKKRRIESQPLEYPSAGSVFRNPEGLSSWKLIDDLGLKGYSVGGAKVSEKHANFVINYNNATANDIKSVIEYVQKKVKEKYNIELKVEQEFVNWE